ncbi:hypothetical protein EON68_00685 [archaeon]|nr:MAG: hypothetical protein EON68_00685 [archaeon]
MYPRRNAIIRCTPAQTHAPPVHDLDVTRLYARLPDAPPPPLAAAHAPRRTFPSHVYGHRQRAGVRPYACGSLRTRRAATPTRIRVPPG